MPAANCVSDQIRAGSQFVVQVRAVPHLLEPALVDRRLHDWPRPTGNAAGGFAQDDSVEFRLKKVAKQLSREQPFPPVAKPF